MQRNNIITGVGLILAVVIGADAAYARPMEVLRIEGTRAQVRGACVGPGMSLYEFATSTTCINEVRHIGITCGNDGQCVASGVTAPRGLRSGSTPRIVLNPPAPRDPLAVPKSLSEQADGGADTMSPPTSPAPPSYPDIIN
jgi:hypothetical protein